MRAYLSAILWGEGYAQGNSIGGWDQPSGCINSCFVPKLQGIMLGLVPQKQVWARRYESADLYETLRGYLQSQKPKC